MKQRQGHEAGIYTRFKIRGKKRKDPKKFFAMPKGKKKEHLKGREQ